LRKKKKKEGYRTRIGRGGEVGIKRFFSNVGIDFYSFWSSSRTKGMNASKRGTESIGAKNTLILSNQGEKVEDKKKRLPALILERRELQTISGWEKEKSYV